jgi:hypothetical protein
MPTSNNNVTTKSSLVFNSNETLEMCDVKVSQEGKVEIATKSHHSEELDRMGRLTKKIGGSLAQNDEGFTFTPYQKGTGKSPYEAQVIVGSTTLKMSKDKVYISFAVPRHLAKALMPLYIQSEMDEVKRRIEEDVYDKYVKTEAPSNAETAENI